MDWPILERFRTRTSYQYPSSVILNLPLIIFGDLQNPKSCHLCGSVWQYSGLQTQYGMLFNIPLKNIKTPWAANEFESTVTVSTLYSVCQASPALTRDTFRAWSWKRQNVAVNDPHSTTKKSFYNPKWNMTLQLEPAGLFSKSMKSNN